MARLLVVDDEPAVVYTLKSVLESEGHEVLSAGDGDAALHVLRQRDDIDLVLSDLKMPRLGGLALLDELSRDPDAPRVIVITAHGSERDAVEAMKRGALDYLPKPFDAHEIVRLVARSLTTTALSRENRRLRARSMLARTLVFQSEAMGRLAELVDRIADKDINVLISGESGVGKELVAQAIVNASRRADRPYVCFNCAALPRELVESELFGHRRGAYTGASDDRLGLFRRADGGTLLLDEVGEMEPSTQAVLLRVLQDGEVRPVGSDTPVAVDVRILAATNSDLVHSTGFRQDLYYRLNVVELRVPPLRERTDDVQLLAQVFARAAAKRFGMDPVNFTTGALARLSARTWPGNVRELKHAVERLVALSSGGLVRGEAFDELELPQPDDSDELSLKAQVEAFERDLLRAALGDCDQNQSQAARRLRISRGTLISKMKKYDLL